MARRPGGDGKVAGLAKKESTREGGTATAVPEPKVRRRPGRPTLSNEQLLDKALDLFLEQGFERTSIDAITAAAGMAKRTVYARYGDKTSLFKAALTRAIEEWIVPVDSLRAVETDDLEESLLAIGRILVANILSPAGLRLMRLTNAESGRMPEIGAYSVKIGTEPTQAYLADLFARHLGKDTSRLATAEDAAQAFLNLVVGGPANASAWGVVFDEETIDRQVRFSVHMMLHGLLPLHAGGGESAAQLEDENLRLKKLLAETLIDMDRLRGAG